MIGSRSAIVSGLGPWSSRGLLVTGGFGTSGSLPPPPSGKPKATILTEGYGTGTPELLVTLGYHTTGTGPAPSGHKPKATILTQGFGVGSPQLLVTLGFNTSGTPPTPPTPSRLTSLALYDTWGGSWGTTWAQTWYRGASGPGGPRPSGGTPAKPHKDFGDRGQSKEQLHRSRVKFGVEEETPEEIIARVAKRQAENLGLDDTQQQQELAEELRVRKIEVKSEHLKSLTDKRQALIDKEIGERLREIKDTEDILLLLILASS